MLPVRSHLLQQLNWQKCHLVACTPLDTALRLTDHLQSRTIIYNGYMQAERGKRLVCGLL